VSWSLDFGIPLTGADSNVPGTHFDPLTGIGYEVQGWISFDSNHSLTFYALFLFILLHTKENMPLTYCFVLYLALASSVNEPLGWMCCETTFIQYYA